MRFDRYGGKAERPPSSVLEHKQTKEGAIKASELVPKSEVFITFP